MPSLRQLDRSGRQPRQPSPQPPACRACGSKIEACEDQSERGELHQSRLVDLRLRPLRRDHQQFGGALRMIDYRV